MQSITKITTAIIILSGAIFNTSSKAQNVGINSTGATPNNSAMLDVASSTKGMLIPRMTGTEKYAVASPATGLLIFQTDTVGFWYYNGTNWLPLVANTGSTPASTGAWGTNGNAGTTPSTAAIGSTVNNNFIGTSDAKDQVFATNNLERMRIKSTGNIGIGITTPTARLTLGGETTQFPIALNILPTNFGTSKRASILIGDWLVSQDAGSGARDFFIYQSSTALYRFFIDVAGNIGIGTNGPTALLSVNGTANKTGGGSWAVFSDARLKKNVQPFTDGLSKLLQINPVTFQYNGKAGFSSKETYVGVIAQEIEKVVPYTIKTVNLLMDPADKCSSEQILEYDANAVTYILINAVKELKAENDILRTSKENSELRIAKLEAAMQKLSPTEQTQK